MMYGTRVALLFAALLVACSSGLDEVDTPDDDSTEFEVDPRLAEEVPIGETNEPGETKEDGFWHNGEEDFSEICKEIPYVEPLEDPEITISIDGRSLHLVDRAGDYDAVFPLGLGRIGSSGESLTPISTNRRDELFYARADESPIEDASTSDRRRWAWNYSCRIWSGKKYNNPASGNAEYRSYFAGLPFIRLEGTSRAVYGLHGPIDNYWRENGGELYRGYVSGGCVRMDPDDLVEVFGRIAGHKTPTRIQTEIEFDDDGLSVDPQRFMNSGCQQDSDCLAEGAVCADHPDGSGGFCTKPCQQQSDCPIMENDIVGSIGVWSFCIDDNEGVTEGPGYCVIEGNAKTNNNCRSYPGSFVRKSLSVVDDDSRTYSVCALP